MNGSQLLSEAHSLILMNEKERLLQLLKSNSSLQIDECEFERFIHSFLDSYKGIDNCININGSGGSKIPKLNLSSIACIYTAAITNMKVVKTGSIANTSLVGSSDLFDKLGLLHAHNKLKGLDMFNFAYYDFLQITAWKRYRDILTLNDSLKHYINNGVFFDYSASTYIMGVALSHYYDVLSKNKQYNPPRKLVTYYTKTELGIIDEITQGDVFLDGDYIFTIDGELYMPRDKKEAIDEDVRLIYGLSNNKSSIDSTRFTTALILHVLCNCSLDEGVKLFNNAYKKRVAGLLVDNLKLLYKQYV